MEIITVHAPGRINIIGEHTDYNQGFVLPAAIDKGTTFSLVKNLEAQSANVFASSLNEKYSFSFTENHREIIGWQSYIFGVVQELRKQGCMIEGFDAHFDGDIPIGSGMSSSASLECSLAVGLNELFQLNLDSWEIILACQRAEHNYVGTKCGIMDQFASIMGKQNQAILLDCQTLDYKYIPCFLDDHEFLLLDSNVSHQLASTEYNTRREECLEAVRILNNGTQELSSLRNLTFSDLELNKTLLTPKIYNRCQHVLSENQRTLSAAHALENGDLTQLGSLMYASHSSLQKHYEVSCVELDFLVDMTRDNPYVLGSRMMGGGFGGCTINLIKKDKREEFTEEISQIYASTFGISLTDHQIKIGNGAGFDSARKTNQ